MNSLTGEAACLLRASACEHRRWAIKHILAHRHTSEIHPDADLLNLCLRLLDQEQEWQRLWDACAEDGSTPDADAAFERFEAETWPGISAGNDSDRRGSEDLPSQLIAARPVSIDGVRAMARATLALEAASAWSDLRGDHCEIMLAVVRAAAGVERKSLVDGSRPR